jgi:hypothetical protein
MSHEIIVLAARTKASPPPDSRHFYHGPPGPTEGRRVDRVLVSCTFTWDKPRAESLREQWARRYPRAEVLVGGPAYGDQGGEFTPGQFLAPGCVITTRGCPGCSHPCLVPEREGPLRRLKVRPGYDVMDNNLLAAPKGHVRAVLAMLAAQREPAKFSGGLDSRFLQDWFVELLGYLVIAKDGLRLAYDAPDQRADTFRAIARLRGAGFSREKVRCYVLVGQRGDTMEAAEARCRDVWMEGAIPFAMLWRGPRAAARTEPGWACFTRAWMLPAIMRFRAAAGWPDVHW